MSVETIAADLRYKRIGFLIGQIGVFGVQLVRPFDLVFELHHVELVTSDLLKLSFLLNPAEGLVSSISELVIEAPGELVLDDKRIVFTRARYVRFEETTLRVMSKQVVVSHCAREESTFPLPDGPAVELVG